MNAIDITVVAFGVFVIGWFVWWFGTYNGGRTLDKFNNVQLWAFSMLCGSMIIALALAAGYFVVETLQLRSGS